MPSGGESRRRASELEYAYLVRALDEAIRLSGPGRWTPLDDLEAQRIEAYLWRRGIRWNPYHDPRDGSSPLSFPTRGPGGRV